MSYRRRSYNSRDRGSSSLWIVILIALIALGAFVYTSKSFERNVPTIQTDNSIFWNRKDPLKIKLTDESALKSYEVKITDGQNTIVVANEMILETIHEKVVEVKYPKKAVEGVLLDPQAKKLQIIFTATDKSNWNFFQGNSVSKTINVHIDYKRPHVNILSNSYSITKGGSALVIFQVKDDTALKSFFVEAGGELFKAQPYKKEGYYATLLAWPFHVENFVANITAEDMAGNKKVSNIPLYLLTKKYKTSWIQAKDNFIDGKISDLIDTEPKYSTIDDRLEKLKTINETMRLENEKIIHSLSKNVSDEMIDSWKIKRFYPLRNGAKVASFGDERHYYYGHKDHEISKSYHVGLDMASTKMAKVITSNPGTVVYDEYNGIYGNMPMIDHGLGLYTLYGHCSDVLVQKGDKVAAGFSIAKTGMSGLALGDHLHFGILVQGNEVRPEEWMDSKWINDNIVKVFKEADKIIDGK
ncbi:MAG: Peptidase, M23/M37 family [uncultured Sulfurovum sp.]|uniref:Peptidase, M23/M37 family n=1 Tax=uncultured Sulfurovum sp. TaxID=269237 RepID=A0A6S6TIY5_9BACT|nr:MAG: Peptidase, M23/M37 family [uncultured Sulfurovum sp.]